MKMCGLVHSTFVTVPVNVIGFDDVVLRGERMVRVHGQRGRERAHGQRKHNGSGDHLHVASFAFGSFMRWTNCSFSRQISSINSASTTMRCLSVTVHGFV